MKIDERSAATGSAAGRPSEVGFTQNTAGAKASPYASRVGDDSVELSGVLRAVNQSQSQRTARVAQLVKAVQGGRYSIDPALIAGKLVSETLASTRDLVSQ